MTITKPIAVTRRHLLEVAGAMLAASQLKSFAQPQLPVLPNSVNRNVKAVGALVVAHAKAGTLTQSHVGQLSGTLSMLFALAQDNGTIASLQKLFTQDYINAFEWTQQHNERLAKLVPGTEEADYNRAQDAFKEQGTQIKPDVAGNIATLMTGFDNLELPTKMVAFENFTVHFKRAEARPVCWPAINAAAAGLLAAASWEIPPISFAFGIVAFFYGVEAAVMC